MMECNVCKWRFMRQTGRETDRTVMECNVFNFNWRFRRQTGRETDR